MDNKIKPYICKSEKDFLELKGEGNEELKVTLDPDEPDTLNGWYIFLKTSQGNNRFFRQSARNSPLIETIECETKYLIFDRNFGIHPDSHHCNYKPIGPQRREYEVLKEKLRQIGRWEENE